LLLTSLGVMSDAFKLPNAISSNMVLQREPLAARLWGFGDLSEMITVTLDGVSQSTHVDSKGNWLVELDKQAASVGRTIDIRSSSGENVTLSNIAFGDVFLCSGQSNMEFSVNDAFDAELEIADSVNYPNLRLYTEQKTAANVPQLDGSSKAPYQWGVSKPDSFTPVGGARFSYFSATCYFFGRDLYKSMDGKVPIGLVASDWGGQKVEVFSSPDALQDATCGGTVSPSRQNIASPGDALDYLPIEQDSVDALPEASVAVSNSQLWNAMIYPFLNMRFTGATWYQGEANAGNPTSYACRFPAMIADWRKKFDLPNLSFFFVQLAAYGQDYAEIRNAQMAALKLPQTGYAAAIDLGDPSSPLGSIHPRRKQEVGRRLALACLKVQYDMDVVATGPVFESFTSDGNSTTLRFEKDSSIGLHLNGTAACTTCCQQSPLEVQIFPGYGWRRTDVPVVSVNALSADVTLSAGESIVGVRFAWEGYPQCALYNGEGGPDDHAGIAATPFRFSQPIPVKSWTPVFRQTYPNIWQPGVLTLNPEDEDSDMFARLDTLDELLSANGNLEFKLRWADPYANEANHWKQSSNPVTNAKNKLSGVDGYEAIHINQTQNGWGGLEYNSNGLSLLDGEPGSGSWYYAIGYNGADWGQGQTIPSFKRAAQAVELFAMNPNTSKWTLVFRQTLPHLWDFKDPWNVNSDDPHAEVYAILDQLEGFRAADGKFELKLMWPDYWNIWTQTSNPAAATPVSGYSPIDVRYTGENFGGLEWFDDGRNRTMIKGTIGTDDWYYSVGWEGSSWGKNRAGFPAWGGNSAGAKQVELFVNSGTLDSGFIFLV